MQFRSRRKPTDYPAVLMTGDGEIRVQIVDANAEGIRVTLPPGPDLPVDAVVALVLRGARYPAAVVWSRDGQAGLDFQRPLPGEVLGMLTRSHAHSDSRPRRFLIV